MPGRGRTTYNKRLKEQKRAEKRQEKETRRQLRKLGAQNPADQQEDQTPLTGPPETGPTEDSSEKTE